MAECVSSFDQGLTLALQRVGKGHLTLKEEQISAIRHVFDGMDVFVWLPTGFGKSIVYEYLPFLFLITTGSIYKCGVGCVSSRGTDGRSSW